MNKIEHLLRALRVQDVLEYNVNKQINSAKQFLGDEAADQIRTMLRGAFAWERVAPRLCETVDALLTPDEVELLLRVYDNADGYNTLGIAMKLSAEISNLYRLLVAEYADTEFKTALEEHRHAHSVN